MRHTTKQDNMIQSQKEKKKNLSMETDPQMTQILDLVTKGFTITVTNMLAMTIMGENMGISRDRNYFFKWNLKKNTIFIFLKIIT